MLGEKYIKIIKEIEAINGKKKQYYKAAEELNELATEVLKNANKEINNRKEIIEEMADVVIMIFQIFDFENIDEELIGAIEYKLIRQKDRMKMYLKEL